MTEGFGLLEQNGSSTAFSTLLKALDSDTVESLSFKDRWAVERSRQQTTLTNSNQHGTCKNCSENFDGQWIWDVGYEFALEGKHYEQNGIPELDRQKAFALADKYAEAYGATRYYGKFGGAIIGIEDPYQYDGVSYWQCLKCKHTWDRFTGKEVKLDTVDKN
jgi:hypothetical protein